MKTLMVYFSWSNNTKKLVEQINKEFNFDIVRIEKQQPYSEDYNTCAYVEAKEEVKKRIYPAIKNLNINLNEYDKILLFFPIWWYTFPMPVGTFINSIKDFKGEIIAFANSYTNDPQYMKNSMHDLKELNNNINFKEGLFNQNVKKHIDFVNKIIEK